MLVKSIFKVVLIYLVVCCICVICVPPIEPSKNVTIRSAATDTKEKKYPPPIIDLAISIDKALFHKLQPRFGTQTKKKLRKFIKKSMSQVEDKFKLPNMYIKVHLNLIGVKFLKRNPRSTKLTASATAYLKDFCMWQSEKKKKRKYFSILITGLNIYAGSKITARSYMNGICHAEKSCALIEWHPFTMVYLIAHEIAHSIGISHDGRPYNACNPIDHIMASKYNPHWQPNTWSVCSKYDMLNAFKKHTTKCLFTKKMLHDVCGQGISLFPSRVYGISQVFESLSASGLPMIHHHHYQPLVISIAGTYNEKNIHCFLQSK